MSAERPAATELQKAHGAVAGWLTYAPKDEFPRALAALDAFVAEWEKLLLEAATVIERMANGASRDECSPELDRVIAALERIAAPKRPDGTYNLSREACEQIAREALRRD